MTKQANTTKLSDYINNFDEKYVDLKIIDKEWYKNERNYSVKWRLPELTFSKIVC